MPTLFLRRAARALPVALALCAAPLAAPVTAQDALDPAAMSDSERAAFRAEIRAYLMENPEVLMEAISVLEAREAAAQAEAEQAILAERADALFDDGYSWVGGNPDGDVTLVEFMDYRCSFCRRAYPEVEALIDSDGNIRRIVKEFPILGEQSVLASRFAIATLQVAGPEAYDQVHDALMTMRGDMNPLSLEIVAEDLGLDVAAIVAHMDDEAVTAVIRANHALAEDLAITGTPTFVLGDRMLRGYVPLEAMRDLVAEERAEG